MTASPTSPGGSTPQSGLSKAERLEELTDPYGPTFPLDEDILEELEDYPGPVPRNAEEYINLLPDLRGPARPA